MYEETPTYPFDIGQKHEIRKRETETMQRYHPAEALVKYLAFNFKQIHFLCKRNNIPLPRT